MTPPAARPAPLPLGGGEDQLRLYMEGPFSVALMCEGWREAMRAETSGILLNSKL